MPVITLKKLIDENFDGIFPDFLDCDIEGLDYDVIKSFNMKQNGPKVVLVEVRENQIDRFDSLLKGYEYFRFCRIGENNLYVRNEYKEQLCHISN